MAKSEDADRLNASNDSLQVLAKLPPGWTLSKDGQQSVYRSSPQPPRRLSLSVSWRQYRPLQAKVYLVLAVLAVVVTFWALTSDDLISILVYAAWAVMAVYKTFYTFFNRTTISLDNDELLIVNGPPPARTQHRFSRKDLQQLYCQGINREGVAKDFPPESYAVYLQLADAHDEMLLNDLKEHRHALLVERLFEQALQIEDTPVEGELAKPL